jgi:hypothetical protein
MTFADAVFLAIAVALMVYVAFAMLRGEHL